MFVNQSFPIRFPQYYIGGKPKFPTGWSKLKENIYDRERHAKSHFILCGSQNNIVVIDADRLKADNSSSKDGVKWLHDYFDEDSAIWRTFHVKTKSGRELSSHTK